MASCGGRARCLLLLSSWLHSAGSLRVPAVSAVPRVQHRAGAPRCSDPVTSPFEASASNGGETLTGPLPLTAENVDAVLDEMRPYLMADGGNVAVAEIDGGVVRLELQGACGSCPSSTVTMKMGIERVLNENFADLGEVVAVDPGPEAGASELSPDVVDAALEQIMPAIIGLGGKIEVISAEGDEVMLKYEGPPKIKFGIELALKDNPLIENVVFL